MQWFPGSVETAIQISQKNEALLIVYITNDLPDGKLLDSFWERVEANSLGVPTVGIRLLESDTAAKQFRECYPTPIIPAVYMIDQHGKPVAVVTTLVGRNFDSFFDNLYKGASFFASRSPKCGGTEAPRSIPFPPPGSDPSEFENAIREAAEARVAEQAAEKALKVERAKKFMEMRKARDEENKRIFQQKVQQLKVEHELRKKDERIKMSAKVTVNEEKDRILAKIKADRENREKRCNNATTAAAGGNFEKKEQKENKEEKEQKPTETKTVQSDRCRLQVRLPDGTTFIEEFPSNDVLNSLVAIIQQKISGSFEITQTYPRRVFTVDDYNKTYLENQLTPSTALIVIAKPSKISSAIIAPSASIFSLILSPVCMLWSWFVGMFKGRKDPKNEKKKNEGPGASGAQPRPRGMPRSAEVRRRGNVAGLVNPNDDDPEEQASFNGNSTQFM
ncbi:unnamed protein product [Caenorhabditis sp. 36 PRJEB53466]|nr:unnamed protein product [Caenorhabditis sp. 36 PRJEB53466]